MGTENTLNNNSKRCIMSGGQKINDHGSWAGGKSKDSPLPMGNKTKHFSSAEGAGAMNEYEDTSEKIQSQQEQGIRKAEGHKQKPSYRN